VSYAYETGPEILHDVSFTMKAGTTLGILGGTGSGKSTMMLLLDKLYELPEGCGTISIGGTDIRKIRLEHLRRNIGIVLQEPFLFSRTLEQNLSIASADATWEDIRQAAGVAQLEEAIRNCGLDAFVRQCPDGVDAILGEDADISAGQKQLITIARAMVDDAPILILDEATSSVDTRTEAVISEAIDKLLEGRTSFVIAHRLSTIRNADLILVLKDGDVLETGTHDELMAKGGFYADLYMSQFDKPKVGLHEGRR
jgi:ATP-binding cassette subfamily B protein